MTTTKAVTVWSAGDGQRGGAGLDIQIHYPVYEYAGYTCLDKHARKAGYNYMISVILRVY